MAVIVVPSEKLVRRGIPLEHVEYIGNGLLVRIRFPEGSTYAGDGEEGTLRSQILQCAADKVLVYGSEEEWREYLEGLSEKMRLAHEKRVEQARAQAAGLVIPSPRIVGG